VPSGLPAIRHGVPLFLIALAAVSVFGAALAAAGQTGLTATQDGPILFQQNGRLVAIDPDGSHLHRVGQIPANLLPGNQGLAVSPDGKTLAFPAVREVDYPGLYVMQSNGTGLHPLLRGNLERGFSGFNTPAFLPGGRLIFSASKGYGGHYHLFSIRLNGTGLNRLTDSSASDFVPFVSPDGQQVVFTRNFGESGQIMTMSPNGSGLRRITSGPCNFATGNYSPTGENFLAVRSCEGSTGSIVAVDSTSFGMTTLTQPPPDTFDTNPYYSPSGLRIAFTQGPPCGPTSQRCVPAQLYTMNADGSGSVQLTHTGPSVFNDVPVWVNSGH
jgi:TolB protein